MTTQDKQTALNAISKAMGRRYRRYHRRKGNRYPRNRGNLFSPGTSLRAPDESD